jgi:hypothetical protein
MALELLKRLNGYEYLLQREEEIVMWHRTSQPDIQANITFYLVKLYFGMYPFS